MYQPFCVPAEIALAPIVLLVVTAEATPTPIPSSTEETSEPELVMVAIVKVCGTM
jgi:hypothetical protein